MITVSKYGFPKKSDIEPKLIRIIGKNVIYCIYFPDSDKMYIGQTHNLWTRMSIYRRSIHNGNLKKNQRKLFNAIMKYDYKFTITVLAVNIDDAKLDDNETSYITMFDSYKNGYNSTGGGRVVRGENHHMFGKKHTAEAKTKMSSAHTGKVLSEQTKTRIGTAFKGKQHTEESKEKMSAALKGHITSEETKTKISLSLSGDKNINFGKTGNMSLTSKPVVVDGVIYCSARYASQKAYPNNNTGYVASFISKNPESDRMFYISKEFYKYCQGSNIFNVN
jgi:group I intron endonuclease